MLSPRARRIGAAAALALGVGAAAWWRGSAPSGRAADAAGALVGDGAGPDPAGEAERIPAAEPGRGSGSADGEGDPEAEDPRPAGRGALVGRVYDESGHPRAGLQLELAGAQLPDGEGPVFDASSDSQGYFSFASVPPGHWELSLQGDGFWSSSWLSSAEVRPDETTVHDVVLAGARSLAGAALYSDEWLHADGAVIRLELVDVTAGAPRVVGSAWARTRTDVPQLSGRFGFEGLPPGIYELRAYPFADHDYCRRAIDLTEGNVRLPAIVFGPDLVFREVPEHPGSQPFDSLLDDREFPDSR